MIKLRLQLLAGRLKGNAENNNFIVAERIYINASEKIIDI